MKKYLLPAAIAATMAMPAFASISIKGDAHYRYANKEAVNGTSGNHSEQRVRLHFTGKAGGTTIKLGLRNDGGTRVSGGIQGDGPYVKSPDSQSGSGRAERGAKLATDYQFITTKIGAINIKVGDWWDTTGFGLVRLAHPVIDTAEFSTKFSGVNFAVRTTSANSDRWYTLKTKIGGFSVGVQHFEADDIGSDDVEGTGDTTTTQK